MPVTPAGVRAGDPVVLATLVARRGAQVRSYLAEVAPPDDVLRATAAAFAEFRITLLTTNGDAFDLAGELLAATRRAAARNAENPLRPAGRRRPAQRTGVCERIPRLLVTWLAGALSAADEARLLEHARACPDCHAASTAFERAEARFARGRDGGALRPADVGALVAAMARASADPSYPR